VIASVEGRVGAVAFESLVVEVGGIGYRVFASPSVVASATPGSVLKLHTYHLVREDQQALYGFRTPEELGFFNLLLTVTGVGPKVALAIVGSRPTPDLQLAIMQQDQAVLVSIPGIGRKLAERVIFELKEKVTAAGVAASAGGPPHAAATAKTNPPPRPPATLRPPQPPPTRMVKPRSCASATSRTSRTPPRSWAWPTARTPRRSVRT